MDWVFHRDRSVPCKSDMQQIVTDSIVTEVELVAMFGALKVTESEKFCRGEI